MTGTAAILLMLTLGFIAIVIAIRILVKHAANLRLANRQLDIQEMLESLQQLLPGEQLKKLPPVEQMLNEKKPIHKYLELLID